MAVAPLRRLALLGGGFSIDDDGLLDDWVLDHARTPRPRVCFVPTASGDAPAYVEKFLAAFQSRPCCELAVLSLFRRELDDDALRAFLLSQDVVYVGGGNTANLLAVWRTHGVDRLLHEAYDRGTLLCGISAQGRTPTGAELDRVAGTNNYGRAVLARWRRTGRIPQLTTRHSDLDDDLGHRDGDLLRAQPSE